MSNVRPAAAVGTSAGPISAAQQASRSSNPTPDPTPYPTLTPPLPLTPTLNPTLYPNSNPSPNPNSAPDPTLPDRLAFLSSTYAISAALLEGANRWLVGHERQVGRRTLP